MAPAEARRDRVRRLLALRRGRHPRRGPISRLRCRIVAGSANNQLAEPADAGGFTLRGSSTRPTTSINAGGVLQLLGLEQLGWDEDELEATSPASATRCASSTATRTSEGDHAVRRRRASRRAPVELRELNPRQPLADPNGARVECSASRVAGRPPISVMRWLSYAYTGSAWTAPRRQVRPRSCSHIGADLLTKAYAVTRGGLGRVVYNDAHAGDFLRRVVMSFVALAVTAVIAGIGRRRGFGRLWGAWVGVGVLVGGVLGNGLSRFIWSRGVPDFIHAPSPDIWNLADFEIGIGLTGGIVSMAVTAIVVYTRATHTVIEESGRVPPRWIPDFGLGLGAAGQLCSKHASRGADHGLGAGRRGHARVRRARGLAVA